MCVAGNGGRYRYLGISFGFAGMSRQATLTFWVCEIARPTEMHYTHAMNWKNGIALFSLASILSAQSAGDIWWAHVQALAAPEMEGRLTGSEGYLRAARYVVAQFDSAGLQPAGSN